MRRATSKKIEVKKSKDEIDTTRAGNYQRGARLERVARASLERQGYTVIRSAGSKGAIDLVAVNSEQVRLIQCKSKGGADKKARERLRAIRRPSAASVELWERDSEQPTGWKIEALDFEIVDRCSHGAIANECKVETCLYSPPSTYRLAPSIKKLGRPMQIVNGIEYLTAEEALARRLVNKAEYERWIYGGLTKKQHDHMIDLAMKSHEKFMSAQHSVHLTAFGVQPAASYPLQLSLFADDPSAIHGGG